MLFEDNKIYTLMRFLVIMFGTFDMTISTVRFDRTFKKKMIIFCVFMVYATIVTWLPIRYAGWGVSS